MYNDELLHVPNQYIDERIDRLVEVYHKVSPFLWVVWRGGYEWKWSMKQPPTVNGYVYKHPTLGMVIARQAMFDNVHKTLKL